MYYHGSPQGGIQVLEPRVSNHGVPQIYFSKKRENVLVYLSNAVKRYCRETGFSYHGIWQKWASYGFHRDGLLVLEEYYPDATRETYQGVSGYIYGAERLPGGRALEDIPNAFVTPEPVRPDQCEFIPDAYEALLAAEKTGALRIVPYEQLSAQRREWIIKTIAAEYAGAEAHPEYRHFLKGKFPFLKK